MTAAAFVNQMNTHAGNLLSPAEQGQLVADLSTSAKTRAQVLHQHHDGQTHAQDHIVQSKQSGDCVISRGQGTICGVDREVEGNDRTAKKIENGVRPAILQFSFCAVIWALEARNER